MLFDWPPAVIVTVAVIDLERSAAPVGFLTEPDDVIVHVPLLPPWVYRPWTPAVPPGTLSTRSVHGVALFWPLCVQPRIVGSDASAAVLMIDAAAAIPDSATARASRREPLT